MGKVYLENLHDYSLINIGEISVFCSDNYIFIGPIRKANTFCLSCFKERLKELGLEKFYLTKNKNIKANELEKITIDNCVSKIKNTNESTMYILDRNTKEIEVTGTFKRGDCIVCSKDELIYRDLEIPNCKFNKDNSRQESWNNVVKKLERNKFLAYKNKFSIVNRLSRSSDAYGLPMVETDVLYKNVSMLSYGRTDKYESAKYTSILESLERYATAFPYKISNYHYKECECPKIDWTISDMLKLNNKTSDKYNSDSKVYYTEVEALHSNKKVLIPEQLIYFNSQNFNGEERYIYESSNGSALGSTYDEASLYAMLELFERDSFLATWYGQIEPTKIDMETIKSEKVKKYILALKRDGIKAHIFDISLELRIPTVWVLLEKINPKPEDMAFYTAASTSFVLDDAIEKALIEAITAISVFVNVFKKQEFQERKRMLIKEPEKVTKLEDHLLLYSNKAAEKYLKFALNTPYHTSYEELEKKFIDFNCTYKEVISHFHKVLLSNSKKVFRCRTENINLNNLGFVNVKYIVPEMLTMTFGHQNRRVVNSRILKAIRYKGRGHLDEEWIANTPHPFP